MNDAVKVLTMTDPKSHLTKTIPLDSQRLAMDFANEVANERLTQIGKILDKRTAGDILPVDALFEIRALSGKQG